MAPYHQGQFLLILRDLRRLISSSRGEASPPRPSFPQETRKMKKLRKAIQKPTALARIKKERDDPIDLVPIVDDLGSRDLFLGWVQYRESVRKKVSAG